jgi:plasmid stabilization system protein ParE
MSYRATYSDDAKQDAKEIVAYLAQFYASTARNFKAKLVERVNALKDMPLSYPTYEEDPFFRRMVLGDYLLFYDVNEKKKLVTVHRIFHHAREIKRLMTEYREQI